MSLFAYRICKAKHKDHLFDGEGAYQHGGRWNSAGHRMVYCAESRSLALLEIFVHLENHRILDEYVIAEVEIPMRLIESLQREELPNNWSSSPPTPSVQEIGDRWITETRSAALTVPSAIIPEEQNVLLNPAHPDFEKLKLGNAEKFEFDSRLLKITKQKGAKRTTKKRKS